MNKYNHSLQYKLALDAVCTPLDTLVYFYEQFYQAELVLAAESPNSLKIGFISSIAIDKLYLTPSSIISLN